MKDVLEIISSHEGMDHSELLRRSRLMKRDLDAVLDTLQASGQIVVDTEARQGRPKRTYRVLTSQEGANYMIWRANSHRKLGVHFEKFGEIRNPVLLSVLPNYTYLQ